MKTPNYTNPLIQAILKAMSLSSLPFLGRLAQDINKNMNPLCQAVLRAASSYSSTASTTGGWAINAYNYGAKRTTSTLAAQITLRPEDESELTNVTAQTHSA